jgi:hypothetical protein
VGYFWRWLADRAASLTVWAHGAGGVDLYVVCRHLRSPARLLPPTSTTSATAWCVATSLFPVTFFGMYSPFAIRLMLRSARNSGMVSGTVYGVSTFGSIVGTLGTTFYLIPTIGTRAITLWLGAAGVVCGLILLALGRAERKTTAPWPPLFAFAAICTPASANEP